MMCDDATVSDHLDDDRRQRSVTLEQILADDFDALDPVVLSRSIMSLKNRGAHRCWHKHSTFLEHLLGVHNILRLWRQSPIIGRVGLFHSAYSNSYVNLALYDPATERQIMKDLIGVDAESLVYLFCIIDRQQIVVNTLLRQGYIPAEGLTVPHLRFPNQPGVYLSASILRMLLVFTMADIADQYFGWQDLLFGGGGESGSMIIPGQDRIDRHDPKSMWPGVSKPGLWVSYVSQLGCVARSWSIADAKDSETQRQSDVNESRFSGDDRFEAALDGSSAPHLPPVFNYCTAELSLENETEARDLYWAVIQEQDISGDDQVVDVLQRCHSLNPWIFEPLVVLAQKFLHLGDFDRARRAANQALELEEMWGTAWDKRLSFAAWRAWTRVLLQRAEDRLPWPSSSWDVNNLGLVR
jgi:ribulose bisphosphate carboxylase small subunit